MSASAALEGNEASSRVSRALGYEDNGKRQVAPRGTPVWEHFFLLTRDRWSAHAHDRTEIVGLESCRDMFCAD